MDRDYVGAGLGGSPDWGFEAGVTNSQPGTVVGPLLHKAPNIAIDRMWTGFADYYRELGGLESLAFPRTDVRPDILSLGTVRDPALTPGFVRLCFLSAVNMLHCVDDSEPIKSALLGD